MDLVSNFANEVAMLSFKTKSRPTKKLLKNLLEPAYIIKSYLEEGNLTFTK